MGDDEKCVRLGGFVWKYHESVGWYDADEDDPAMDTETALLDEIERLRAIERYAEHRYGCEQPDTASRVCPCGLTELLEARRG